MRRVRTLAIVGHWLVFGLTLGALVLAPDAAEAYCRMTTAQLPTFSCPEDCREAGTPLFWGVREIEYAFSQRGFAAIDDVLARGVFGKAFATWSSVECAGQQLGFQFDALPPSAAMAADAIANEPTVNAISLLSAEEWNDLGYSPHAFAKTEVWFDRDSGEILGADLVFNGAFSFAICPQTGCPGDVVDLQNVAAHELGHFLGLGHSQNPEAAMWCDAQLGDIRKRVLKPDDVAGLCAIYDDRNMLSEPGTDTGASPSQTEGGGGCSVERRVSRGGAKASCWGLGFCILLALGGKLRGRRGG